MHLSARWRWWRPRSSLGKGSDMLCGMALWPISNGENSAMPSGMGWWPISNGKNSALLIGLLVQVPGKVLEVVLATGVVSRVELAAKTAVPLVIL